MPHPIQVVNDLQAALLRYMDTIYWIRDSTIRAERRALLSEEGALLREPLLEPLLPYDGTEDAAAVCREVGLSDDEARWLIGALFNVNDLDAFKLRAHQAEAMRVALAGQPPCNPVVTAGTGSGKTEAFLLPVLARLMLEARCWARDDQLNPWWEGSSWRPARVAARPAAMRAMILYPMNALVEDQMARLRRALRRLSRAGGPMLWFGRYTSATPGGTVDPRSAKGKGRVLEVGGELRGQVLLRGVQGDSFVRVG